MALAGDGSLYTWGDARYGQLGHSHLINYLNVDQPLAVSLPQKVQALDPAEQLPGNRYAAGAFIWQI